ncbi:SH3 domain-binding protein 5 [Oopsacas minuta]|uniref:SH3 domain-binding protein 5 n=1 Tax=Oopsacas minuta TaxID=111878 RepID=A0AAV7JU93_9METZ|nr:SH3 domain-binding protein 5 [Oopsacas minuta]
MAESAPLLSDISNDAPPLQEVVSSQDLLGEMESLTSPESNLNTPVHVENKLATEELVECSLPLDEACEEPLDPRIKDELDTMNASGDDINNLEAQVLRIKTDLSKIMNEGNFKLDEMKLKIGDKTIENAKIYYTTLIKAKRVHRSLLKATRDFDLANKDRQTAKDELRKVEEDFLVSKSDKTREEASRENNSITKQQSSALEGLNVAITRVNELDEVVLKRENMHQQKSLEFTRLVATLQECKKKHRRNILKAKSYFETKYHYEHRLMDLMATRRYIFDQLKHAKVRYNVAMHNLETISLQIHNMRGDVNESVEKFLNNPLLLDGEGSLDGSSLGISEIDPSIANQNSITTGSVQSVNDLDDLSESLNQISIPAEPVKTAKTSYTKGRLTYL